MVCQSNLETYAMAHLEEGAALKSLADSDGVANPRKGRLRDAEAATVEGWNEAAFNP